MIRQRRHFERIECGGSAALLMRGVSMGHFELRNLCVGGALVEGESRVARGHLVHLVMNIPGLTEPVGISALVHEVRVARDHFAQLVLTFPVVSADIEDYIQDAILASLTQKQEPVLVTAGRRAPLRQT